MKRWSAVHVFLYRITGGMVGRRLVDNDILLLTTRGHETGRRHTVPLLYLRNGRSLVVIASYGGRRRHPTWYRNLLAEPEVVVQVKSRKTRMVARTATMEERSCWWPKIVGAYEGYTTYQLRTDREIPVVFLEPAEEPEHESS